MVDAIRNTIQIKKTRTSLRKLRKKAEEMVSEGQ